MKIIKHGAMFGLDARIALAIFGALSVISGAALYSAIQDAKVTAAVAELEEISKALIQFNLDTGQDLPYYNAAGVQQADQLIDSSITGANTPYLPYEETGNGFTFILNLLGKDYNAHIYTCAGAFGNEASNVACDTCSGGNACSPWLKLSEAPESYLTALDAKIDGADGYDKGKFRVQWADAGKTDGRLFYQLTGRLLTLPQ